MRQKELNKVEYCMITHIFLEKYKGIYIVTWAEKSHDN